MLAIDWRITEQLSLTTGRGITASQGPGLTLNYELRDRWNFALTSRYEKVRFALEGDGMDKERRRRRKEPTAAPRD